MRPVTLILGFLLTFAFVLAPFAGPSSQELSTWKIHSPNSTQVVDHSDWDQILQKYISNRSGVHYFAYGKVTTQDKQKLKNYLKTLSSLNPQEFTRSEAMAFWINAYNAITVDIVLDNYPVESIKDIKSSFFRSGPWKTDIFKIQGQHLSLDNIEHGILRPIFMDSRVHYAVNCASYSCPNLASKAFTSNNLNQLLNQGATDYINHSRGVQFNTEGDLVLSSIWKWFKEDFGSSEAAVIKHLKKYAKPGLKAQLETFDGSISYDYGWKLNE